MIREVGDRCLALMGIGAGDRRGSVPGTNITNLTQNGNLVRAFDFPPCAGGSAVRREMTCV